MEQTLSITLSKLQEKFKKEIVAVSSWRADDCVVIRKEALVAVAAFLRDDPELDYNMLVDIGAVDYLNHPKPQPERFAVAYHFLSLKFKHRVRVKVFAGLKDPEIDTLCGMWKAANWMEREVFDQYGLKFKGHPNLKRILNHAEFVGHPLRKDYPIRKRQVLTESDTLMDEMQKRLEAKGLTTGR
ncbi:MAG TPA: NADH-quinone oxidoreductase subunit C [Pantanalinema sp.]